MPAMTVLYRRRLLLAVLLAGGLGAAQADSYRVYPVPVPSPDHGPRALVTNPAEPNASPFGWHDTNGTAGAEFTTLQGNNVIVYVDADGNGVADGPGPDGGAGLAFDHAWSPAQAPSAYTAALATNAFYWGNMLHDIFWRHGFDEPARNMQQNNYGRGGTGNDPLIIEILSGANNNNVNNVTWIASAEGISPRVRTYVWNSTTPNREASFDTSAMIYGYGKVIEARLNTPGCFNNAENPSSGYADFLAALLTNDFATTTSVTPRGLGTYLLGQPVGGTGIRPVPYTTDMSVNNYTYLNTRTLPSPHGVGVVWGSMLWDLTWLMVQEYGASNNWFNGNGAENRMLRLAIRAQRLQPCSAGFVSARDAVLAADVELYAGANQCRIWQAFSRRGLGFSAAQGSAGSNADNTQAFDLPPQCNGLIFANGFQ